MRFLLKETEAMTMISENHCMQPSGCRVCLLLTNSVTFKYEKDPGSPTKHFPVVDSWPRTSSKWACALQVPPPIEIAPRFWFVYKSKIPGNTYMMYRTYENQYYSGGKYALDLSSCPILIFSSFLIFFIGHTVYWFSFHHFIF